MFQVPAAKVCSIGFQTWIQLRSIRLTRARPRRPSKWRSRVARIRPATPPPTTTMCGASCWFGLIGGLAASGWDAAASFILSASLCASRVVERCRGCKVRCTPNSEQTMQRSECRNGTLTSRARRWAPSFAYVIGNGIAAPALDVGRVLHIQQGDGVVRLLEIWPRVVRRSPGKPLDARIVHVWSC